LREREIKREIVDEGREGRQGQRESSGSGRSGIKDTEPGEVQCFAASCRVRGVISGLCDMKCGHEPRRTARSSVTVEEHKRSVGSVNTEDYKLDGKQ
jgi:hypothetical protein